MHACMHVRGVPTGQNIWKLGGCLFIARALVLGWWWGLDLEVADADADADAGADAGVMFAVN